MLSMMVQALAKLKANLSAEDAASSKLVMRVVQLNLQLRSDKIYAAGRAGVLWPYYPNPLIMAQLSMYEQATNW